MIAQGREGAVRLGAAPAAPPPLGRDRVPGGARATPCPGLTRDGVGVVVPGLLGDVEDAGGHCPCPAWQFAVGTVSGDPSGQGSAGVTQPCIAKHSLALGPPFPPLEPTCYLGPSPPPQDVPRDPHLHLRTLICIPAPLLGDTASSSAPASVFQHCRVHLWTPPGTPVSLPRTLSPAPDTLPSTLGLLQGPSPAPQDPHLHLTTPSGTPIASQDPSQCPTRDPCQLRSTFICTPGPPGDLCQLLISTPVPPSPPQVPTSSPDTLTPSPRNTHPSSWTLTPSPGLSPWMFLFPPSTPAGSGSLRSREVGFD